MALQDPSASVQFLWRPTPIREILDRSFKYRHLLVDRNPPSNVSVGDELFLLNDLDGSQNALRLPGACRLS